MYFPVQVYLGKIRDYEGSRPSAIGKVQVEGELSLTRRGLVGDQQAEKKIHGGADRALCHYPREHYAVWAREYPEQAEWFAPPAFGENLSTLGLTEENAFIGDIFRWGEALIQITQPRSPCFKVNFHSGISELSGRMQDTARCGWLYRVIGEGKVFSDAPLELVSRVSAISVREAAAIAWHTPFDDEQYHRLLSAGGLRPVGRKRCKTGVLTGRSRVFRAGCGVEGSGAGYPKIVGGCASLTHPTGNGAAFVGGCALLTHPTGNGAAFVGGCASLTHPGGNGAAFVGGCASLTPPTGNTSLWGERGRAGKRSAPAAATYPSRLTPPSSHHQHLRRVILLRFRAGGGQIR